jgi:ferredoxin
VRICPTNALFKRRDGIVDLHGDSCIGCRACMEACPYDQLFIDPNTRTAEKCNFCANRVENKLLPACVSVCPTECRIFGDLDDPASEVARIHQREAFMVRKPEKGTLPKILYLGAEESVIRPETRRARCITRKARSTCGRSARRCRTPARPGIRASTTTSRTASRGASTWCSTCSSRRSPRGPCWCRRCSGWLGFDNPLTLMAGAALSLVFITLTAVVLIIDLERPERFYYILTRGNHRSWMVWGAYFLTAHAPHQPAVAARRLVRLRRGART